MIGVGLVFIINECFSFLYVKESVWLPQSHSVGFMFFFGGVPARLTGSSMSVGASFVHC